MEAPALDAGVAGQAAQPSRYTRAIFAYWTGVEPINLGVESERQWS